MIVNMNKEHKETKCCFLFGRKNADGDGHIALVMIKSRHPMAHKGYYRLMIN